MKKHLVEWEEGNINNDGNHRQSFYCYYLTLLEMSDLFLILRHCDKRAEVILQDKSTEDHISDKGKLTAPIRRV